MFDGAPNYRVLSLMGEHGHINIAWTEEQDEKIKELIEKKMKEGYTFWTVVPAHFEQPRREVKVTKVADIGELRNVIIRDADADRLFKEGLVGVISDAPAQIEGTKKAKTADQVAKSPHSVGVRPARGG